MRFAWVCAVAALFTGPITTACSDDKVCTDYNPPASFDAQNPPVTLSKDVMPVFGASCSLSNSCHKSPSNPNGVVLAGTSAEVHRRIVGVRSSRLPTMSYVEPGDPRNSFLLRKMDHSHCLLNAQCTDSSCGEGMPDSESEPLDEDSRNKVRRWIAQGAKND